MGQKNSFRFCETDEMGQKIHLDFLRRAKWDKKNSFRFFETGWMGQKLLLNFNAV
jgi:hypothetical protein